MEPHVFELRHFEQGGGRGVTNFYFLQDKHFVKKVLFHIVVTSNLKRFRIVTHCYIALVSIKTLFCETKIFYSLKNKYKTKPKNDFESTSKIKVKSRWKDLKILLTSAVICI